MTPAKSTAKLALAVSVAFAAAPGSAFAAGKLYYGSRAGMQVTVVSVAGLDTRRAVITTRHTREDATAFCRDYVGKVTADCVREELRRPLNDEVTADCTTGTFTDFFGRRHQFRGRAKTPGSMARYGLVDLSSGEEADGSSASGYGVAMGIFRALCPASAPNDD